MNYNSLMNKPTINYRELIGDSTVSEVGGITEEEFNTLMNTDLASYYTKAQIDELFARSFVYREKSGSIVTFDCPASVNGIDKVVSEIVAVQSGTGDPSPTNVRPITGWSAVNVAVSPTTDAEDGTTYTTTLKDGQGNPMTCYGGTLDVVSGVLTVDRVSVDLGTLNWTYSSETNRERFSALLSGVKWVSDSIPINAICSALVVTDFYTVYNHVTDNTIGMWHGTTLAVCSSAYTDVATFKTAMDGVQLVYELETPQTIQLTPTAVKSLLGTNNIWADSGDIEVKCLDRIIPAGE